MKNKTKIFRTNSHRVENPKDSNVYRTQTSTTCDSYGVEHYGFCNIFYKHTIPTELKNFRKDA